VVKDVELTGWCQLWRLQSGDVSWPESREG